MDETETCIQELCHAVAKVSKSHQRGIEGCKRLLHVQPLHGRAGCLAKEMVQIAAVYNHCHLPTSLAVLRKCIDLFLPYTILTAEQFAQSAAEIAEEVRRALPLMEAAASIHGKLRAELGYLDERIGFAVAELKWRRAGMYKEGAGNAAGSVSAGTLAGGLGLATAEVAVPLVAAGPVGWAVLAALAGGTGLFAVATGALAGKAFSNIQLASAYGDNLKFVSAGLRQAASSFTDAVREMARVFQAIATNQERARDRSSAAAVRASTSLQYHMFKAHAGDVIKLCTTAEVYLTEMQHEVTFLRLSQAGVRAWVAGLDGREPGMAELKLLAGF